MSFVVSHPSVAPFIQQAARALHEAGQLERFYTTLRDDPESTWQKIACRVAGVARYDLRTQLRRRVVRDVPLDRVTAFPFRELLRLASGAVDRSGRLTDLVWSWAEPGFDRAVARRVHAGLTGVYGFEYSSLATFQAARARGLKVVYDVPAPEPLFVQAMLNREVAQHPALATAYHAHTEKREGPRIERRRAEWAAADLIVAASEFTKKTYVGAGLDGSRIGVVPYGAPPPGDRDAALTGGSVDQPLRILWAGTFSVRKGAHYLLDAWRRGGFGRHARLRIHGAITLPDALLHPLPEGVEIGGSIPRDQLMDVYRRSDALIFPTLCDGFGMVATEAWSRGLPVITTTCAGAADLVRPESNGLLLEAGSTPALIATLQWCLDHRAALHAMREASLATAAGWQWSDYRRALTTLLRERGMFKTT